MPRYIQINEEGYIVSDSQLSGEVDNPLMIPVDSDFQCGNIKYDFETGEWVEYIPEPTPGPEPSQLDRIESAVNDIAKNNTSYAEMASAIAEGVNDIE